MFGIQNSFINRHINFRQNNNLSGVSDTQIPNTNIQMRITKDNQIISERVQVGALNDAKPNFVTELRLHPGKRDIIA